MTSNNMDTNQTGPKGLAGSGFIVFASIIKSSLKCCTYRSGSVVECSTSDRGVAGPNLARDTLEKDTFYAA